MTSKPVIAVLRHAEYEQPSDTPSAWLPYPLTAQGTKQARAAVESIAAFANSEGLGIAPVVHSSHMLRAWQTAKIIADGLGLERIDEFAALAERSVGAAANLTVQQIEDLLRLDPRYAAPPAGWKSSLDYRLPFQGAESLAEAGRRVAAHLEQRCDELADGATLAVVVGHGASIRHAAMHMGLLSSETVGAVSMYHARPVFLRREKKGWQMVGGEWKQRSKHEHSDEYSGGR